MNANRGTAIVVGVLYIIGTLTGILSLVFTDPILKDPDYLGKASANGNQVVIGALFVLAMGLSLAMVPVMMFPILKKVNEALALGYIVFRGALETFTYMLVTVFWILLVPLGHAYLQAGSPAVSSFQPLGTLLLKAAETSSNTTEIVFPLGALMFYYLLYRSKVIPRWISGWGLVSVVPFLTASFLHLFGVIGQMSTIENILVAPLGVQEMVMAVWMIAKGFNAPAIVFGSTRAYAN